MAGWKKLALEGDYSEPGHAHVEDDITDLPLHKYDATAAPTVNNDVDEGYTPGSRWIDVTNDKAYVCLDNTDGAAVWTEVTQAGNGNGGIPTEIEDDDEDTGWRAEENADEDKLRGRVGGTERHLIQTTTPHHTLTGDAKITGGLGLAGAAPSSLYGLRLQPSTNPTGTSYYALSGIATLEYTSGGSAGGVFGLNFMAAVGVGGGGASIPAVAAIYSRPAAFGFTGTIVAMYGLWQPCPYITGGAPSVTTYRGVGLDPIAVSTIVDAYGVHIGDITANSGVTRLLEVGPSTPYFRVVGGGDAAARETNVYIKEEATLRQMKTVDAEDLQAGQRVVVLV